MFTKTLLALSLIAGSTIAITSYSQSANFQITSLNPLQITQLPQQEIDSIARNITVKVRNAENEGSGIIITKDNDTYTVITNASLTDGENYTIQTPDGMKHEAIVTGDNTENDLAILEFASDEQYQTATIGNSDSITPGETVIAAGFPESTDELLVTEGKISLFTEKPLDKGYSIGFTNETVQGMSGGVLLNSNGEVIGVLGKGKGAILDTAYDYADGTTPTDEEIATFREVAFSIPIQNIANLSPQLAQLVPGESNQPEIAQQAEYTGIVKTVDDIAQQITVRIATAELDSYGSGVIIAKDGSTYYVATVAHNFPEGTTNTYQIVTSDGESHQLDLNTVKKSDAYDFALFSFTSENDYTVATIGNYTVAANDEQTVFVSGFPLNQSPQRIITGGRVRKQDDTSFLTKDFYSAQDIGRGLLYTNLSYGGMSGGAVLDSEGRLIGINTGADNELYYNSEGNRDDFGLGYSLGVPLQDVFSFLHRETPLELEWLQITQNPALNVSESDYETIEAQLLTTKQPEDKTNISAWMNYGNQLWRYERFDEAASAFERVIAIAPDFDKAYYTLGLTYWDRKDYKEAIIQLNKAVEINPNPDFYWRYLGNSYGKLKQYDKAIASYEQAISKSPKDFVLYVEYGSILSEARFYNKAITSFNKAAEINPEHPWIYNNRGLAYDELEQYDKALLDYERAIELNPQDANPYTNRGNSYQQLKQYDKALVSHNKAIELAPQNDIVYNNRGLLYDELKQYDLAIADYEKAIALNPNQARAYTNLGSTYYSLKQYELALANHNKAIEMDANFAFAYNNRGATYDELKQYDKAVSDYTQAIEIDPLYFGAYFNRAFTYSKQGKLDLALSDYTQAIEIDSEYAPAYFRRALIYDIQGKLDSALSDYTQAIEINPQDADAYYSRATVYDEREEFDLAFADYTQAIEIDSEYADAYNNRGTIYLDRQKFDLALSDYNKAVEINPQLAGAYVNLAFVYWQLKDIEQAKINLQKAQQLYIAQGETDLAENMANLLKQLP